MTMTNVACDRHKGDNHTDDSTDDWTKITIMMMLKWWSVSRILSAMNAKCIWMQVQALTISNSVILSNYRVRCVWLSV